MPRVVCPSRIPSPVTEMTVVEMCPYSSSMPAHTTHTIIETTNLEDLKACAYLKNQLIVTPPILRHLHQSILRVYFNMQTIYTFNQLTFDLSDRSDCNGVGVAEDPFVAALLRPVLHLKGFHKLR